MTLPPPPKDPKGPTYIAVTCVCARARDGDNTTSLRILQTGGGGSRGRNRWPHHGAPRARLAGRPWLPRACPCLPATGRRTRHAAPVRRRALPGQRARLHGVGARRIGARLARLAGQMVVPPVWWRTSATAAGRAAWAAKLAPLWAAPCMPPHRVATT